MPLPPPVLDTRRYQDLLDEVLSRIPVHTPEWTNFNASDPGVTLAALFAFLTENSLHLLNRVPDNLRARFLERLEYGLRPGSGAHALVTIANERGPLEAVTLDADLEVRADDVPFRTTEGLDVLPLEAQAYVKRTLVAPAPDLVKYYQTLYTSFLGAGAEGDAASDVFLYDVAALPAPTGSGVDLGTETVDRTLWVALLVPTLRKPYAERRAEIRKQIAGRTLSLGLVPVVDASQGKVLEAGRAASATSGADTQLTIELPQVSSEGGVDADREPKYRQLLRTPVPTAPAVLQVTLPSEQGLLYWDNLDPLEPGTGNFPPALEDTTFGERLITWLRIRWPEGALSRVLWCGVNTVLADQRKRILNEVLPPGNGRPDQRFALAHKPVVTGSCTLAVTTAGETLYWSEVEDLAAAGPEVSARDPAQQPGTLWEMPRPAEVFVLDAEAGVLRFGDGLRGKRPPADARLSVSYDFSQGKAGNRRGRAINQAPALPPGFTVHNPLPSWGGADPETAEEGQKQVARWLQHRDRLVTEDDFRTIAKRTPGLEVGRVEVLPLYDPRLGLDTEPGAAPGVVTLLVVPQHDALHPTAPEPSAPFLQALCQYLEPRRLLTTEIVLRGPVYRDLWVSVGIGVGASLSVAVVRTAVESALRAFLSPLPETNPGVAELSPLLTAPNLDASVHRGWPWRKAVTRGELVAAVARTAGVVSVIDVKLAVGADGGETEQVAMGPLNLPRLAGLSVSVGPALDIDQIRGSLPAGGGERPPSPRPVPVPVIPREC